MTRKAKLNAIAKLKSTHYEDTVAETIVKTEKKAKISKRSIDDEDDQTDIEWNEDNEQKEVEKSDSSNEDNDIEEESIEMVTKKSTGTKKKETGKSQRTKLRSSSKLSVQKIKKAKSTTSKKKTKKESMRLDEFNDVQLRQVFELLDQDGRGYLLPSDIKIAADLHEVAYFSGELPAMLIEADKRGDRNGRVSFEDFLAMMRFVFPRSVDATVD